MDHYLCIQDGVTDYLRGRFGVLYFFFLIGENTAVSFLIYKGNAQSLIGKERLRS